MAKYELALNISNKVINKSFLSKEGQDFLKLKDDFNINQLLDNSYLKVLNNTFYKWFNKSFVDLSKEVSWKMVSQEELPGMVAAYGYGEDAILVSSLINEVPSLEGIISCLAHELAHHVQFKYKPLDIKMAEDGMIGCIEAATSGDYTKYMTAFEVEAFRIQKEILNAFHVSTDGIDYMLSFVK